MKIALLLVSLLLMPLSAVAQAGDWFLQWDHMNSDEAFTRTCMMVYPDGRFRWEKTYQPIPSDTDTKVAEGKLSQAELDQLNALLNDDTFKAYRQSNQLPPGQWLTHTEISTVRVRREAEVQTLQDFSARQYQAQNLGINSARTMNDLDTRKVIKPVTTWLRDKVEKRKDKTKLKEEPICAFPPNFKSVMK